MTRKGDTDRTQQLRYNEMYLTRTANYALKLSLNQSGSAQVYRKSIGDRGTARSAVVLATVGLSMSMFSLKQMLSSQVPQTKVRRTSSF
ncbi:uncharacterized protein LOC135162750 [Diachasmimorpha longicaudata]|uniref:uncharacterized protein LOC135162750 n=1 Tax=Diachasmimorpha longicaudata TaxID=58733 RepID=UPI0030B89944